MTSPALSLHPLPPLAATSRVGCPVSYDVSPAAIALANTLDHFIEFLRELSGCGTADTFDAAADCHADAVVMLAGGPWRVEMPWECEEPVGEVSR